MSSNRTRRRSTTSSGTTTEGRHLCRRYISKTACPNCGRPLRKFITFEGLGEWWVCESLGLPGPIDDRCAFATMPERKAGRCEA